MTDIVYGIRITGEASGAKKAFEETGQAQKKLSEAERESARQSAQFERSFDVKAAVLNRVRLAALGAGVAMLALGRSAINAAVEAERSIARLNAIFTATGGTAGLSRAQQESFVQRLARETRFDDESIRDAMAVLSQFQQVSGETFTDAIRVASGLAEVMKTDLQSAVRQLGLALEDPVTGLTQLRRAGVTFSPTAQQLIKDMVDTGRQAEAMTLILTELKSRGLAAVATEMNQGVSKETSDLGKNWNDLLEAFGRTRAVQGPVTGALSAVNAELVKMKNLIERGTFIQKLAGLLSKVPGVGIAFSPLAALGPEPQAGADTPEAAAARRAAQEARFEVAFAAQQAQAREFLKKFDEEQKKKREAAAADRAAVAAELAASLQAQQDILDEGSDLSVKFLQQQDQKTEALREEAEAVRAAIDPWHAYRVELERLQKLRDQGFLTEVDFVEAVGQAANKAAGELQDMGRTTENVFSDMKGAVDDFGRELARSLARGEEGFRSLGDVASRFLEELLAIQLERRLIAPALNAGTSFLDNLFRPSTPDAFTGNAAPFHGGRGPGEFGTPRAVHPGLFRHAPRLHTGIGPGELPAIIRHDESVLTPGQMRALGGGSLKINVINESGVPVQGQASALRVDASGMAVDLVLRRLAVDGGARQQLRGMLGRPEN